MKNTALTICLALFLAACSSGSSVSQTPPTITGLFVGPFESNNGRENGTLTMNLAEDTTTGNITGNLIVEFNEEDPSCITNSLVTGTVTGFNVALAATDVTFQLTASGNTLNGTYVSTGQGCSNNSGSGTISLSR